MPQRLTFMDNATAGANAVLRSLRWRAGERIVIADCKDYGPLLAFVRS